MHTANISIWEKDTYYQQQDIIIVGAGLMGLWTAVELKKSKPSLKITIIESGSIATGASTRNAGFACFGSATELLHDAATMGISEMLSIAEDRYKGILKIREHFSEAIIDYNPCGGYECINAYDNLAEQLAWLNNQLQNIIGDDCYNVCNNKLNQFGLKGFDNLVENKYEGSLHSGKLVNALTQKVQELGVQILFGSHVHAIEETSNSVQIKLANTTVSASIVIVCTNAFTQQLLPNVNVVPARGQIVVTSPIPNLTLNGTFHFDEGFYYWRNIGNRILLGGARNLAFEEEATTSFEGSTLIKNALEQFLQKHIAGQYQYTIEQYWSGIMGFTHNKKPLIQKAGNNIYAAIACNGMGVALTPIVAEKLAATIVATGI